MTRRDMPAPWRPGEPERSHERDEAVSRLRRITKVATATTVAATGILSGFFAYALPGHAALTSSGRPVSATTPTPASPTSPSPPAAAPPTTATAPTLLSGLRAPSGSPPPTTAPNPPAPNPVCTLTVPANPLTAAGLARPYELAAANEADGPCHEANPNQSAFVEATILDPATGALSIYRPLVVDRGSTPAERPTVPTLPPNAVVGIWFGFNGTTLTLRPTQNSLVAGNCVNGLADSSFGQVSYCNATAFFTGANSAISKGQLRIPAVGTGSDGLRCPTTRDFGIVDQDQSDNVPTAYLVTADGRTAQSSSANTAALAGAQPVANGSDNRLLDAFVDPAVGCTPFEAPDLTNGGTPAPALALNELQAAADQAPPVALVPQNDPMTKVGTRESVAKTDLYRAGVDQPPIDPATETDAAYCSNLAKVSTQRLTADRQQFQAAPSPDPANAPNLLAFLQQRRATSLQLLDCQQHGSLMRTIGPKAIQHAPADAAAVVRSAVR